MQLASDEEVRTLSFSVPRTLGEHYYADARDFASRFDRLWEMELHKSGRIKTFVDLLMGCECALKSHIFLGRENEDTKSVYRAVRKMGHDIGKLADYANYLSERSLYERVKDQLGTLSVFLRYSLDAYETFWPSALNVKEARCNHSRTIGSHRWVMNVRSMLEELLAAVNSEYSGIVDSDLARLIEHERAMCEFVNECMRP